MHTKNLLLVRSYLLLLFCVLCSPGLSAQDVFDAARKGDLARLEFLFTLKPDTIEAINSNSFTPLVIAVYRGQNEAAEWLLKKGANVNANSPEGPAIVAAGYKGNEPILKLLIQYKAALNATNEEGITALMYAVMGGHTGTVKLLLEHGADKTLKSQYGKTALDYARMYERKELIKILE